MAEEFVSRLRALLQFRIGGSPYLLEGLVPFREEFDGFIGVEVGHLHNRLTWAVAYEDLAAVDIHMPFSAEIDEFLVLQLAEDVVFWHATEVFELFDRVLAAVGFVSRLVDLDFHFGVIVVPFVAHEALSAVNFHMSRFFQVELAGGRLLAQFFVSWNPAQLAQMSTGFLPAWVLCSAQLILICTVCWCCSCCSGLVLILTSVNHLFIFVSLRCLHPPGRGAAASLPFITVKPAVSAAPMNICAFFWQKGV